MQISDVLLQVALSFLVDPSLEIVEVESVRVIDLPVLQPFQVVTEVVPHFLPVENTVYHVTTKQTQLYLVSSVSMDLLVLVDCLENVRCCRSVCELQLLERIL